MIVKLEEAKYSLQQLMEKVEELGDSMSVERLRGEIAEKEKLTQVDNFWQDADKSSKLLQEIKSLKTRSETTTT